MPTRFWLPLCFLLMVSCASAKSNDIHKNNYYKPEVQVYPDFSWTKEAWNENDSPYQQARQAIDQNLKPEDKLSVLVQSLKREALKRPNDPISKFRWAYAAYAFAKQQSVTDQEGADRLSGVAVALAKAKSPHTYNYARIRFLVLAYSFPPFQLKAVGKRLLKINPNDAQTKQSLVAILVQSPNTGDIALAETYAKQLATSHPSEAVYQGLIAGVDYKTWFRTKSRADADKAIAAYQRYLDIAPSNAAFRENATALIAFIRQFQAHWDARERLPE